MMIDNIFSSFLLGLATPLTAVCTLPLYPGFIAYLANKMTGKKSPILIGSIIVLGVMAFMFLLGLLFTTILQVSLSRIIGVVSPVAFAILAIISIFLILDIDFGKFLPRAKTPQLKNPLLNSFVFGFFFGAIVIPCNPAFIAVLFAKEFLSNNVINSILSFLSFGFGLGLPLLVFSVISQKFSSVIINFLTKNKRIINLVSGLVMFGISVYYLVFVFRVWELIIK